MDKISLVLTFKRMRGHAIDARHIRREDRRNQDISANEELTIHRKELRLIRELPEQRAHRRGSVHRCVGEQ